ncbi:GTPase-activating protein SEC13 [Sugiyamaella lignohabitans]|uniref:GTPase-activating protein SEC13 n=1 Tax=Sugiyamaella lignohabitans TaxID=796027 RepID=A0A167DBA9_9ASCO|nr:GTPase-activating protein SEC13 [Sugiyamaella lignohabitans]ANB12711.1 GTPase-activating protein SEC13 [Sugiyamaella lignohabitans]
MVSIGNAHNDLIHDAVLDYYGKRLATCSSDKTIKIFEIDGETQRLIDTLRGHDGPVWQVSWAHPKFGVILASASYDGKAFIWREDNGQWSNIAQHAVHQASVNSVSWAPQEYGALLLCASSDGKVSIVEFKDDGKPDSISFPAHAVGVNAASWAPPSVSGSIIQTGAGATINAATDGNGSSTTSTAQETRRFASGGCDNLVKIWKFDSSVGSYVEEVALEGHTDWVRDVAWSPSVLSKSYIASASQDKTVIIWTQEGSGPWKKNLLKSDKFPDVVWRVSWSLSGNILAVSGGDNKVTLWKENLNGEWESAGVIDE